MPPKRNPKDSSKTPLMTTFKIPELPNLMTDDDPDDASVLEKRQFTRGNVKDVAIPMASRAPKKQPVVVACKPENTQDKAVTKAKQPDTESCDIRGQKRKLEGAIQVDGVKVEKLAAAANGESRPAPNGLDSSCNFCGWIGREVKRQRISSGEHSGGAAALISCRACSEKGRSFETSELKFVDDRTIQNKDGHLSIAVFPRSARDALQDVIDKSMSSVKKSEAAIAQIEHDIRLCKEKIASRDDSLVRLRPCLIEFDAKSKGDQEIRKKIQQFVDEINGLKVQIDEKAASVEYSLKPMLQKECEKLRLLETIVKGILV